MSERDVQVVLVLALLASAILETIVHGMTWWVLRGQQDSTSVGSALRLQMLALTGRFLSMIGFHGLLAWTVIAGIYPVDTGWRITLYTFVVFATMTSSAFGMILIRRLHEVQEPPPDLGDAIPDKPP